MSKKEKNGLVKEIKEHIEDKKVSKEIMKAIPEFSMDFGVARARKEALDNEEISDLNNIM